MSAEDRDGRPEGWDAFGESWRDREPASTFRDLDLDSIRKRARAFARKIRRRNLIELAAGLFVLVCGALFGWRAETWLARFGAISMCAGVLLVIAVLFVRGGNLPPPSPDAPTREVIAYERRQLDRQIHLLERVWLWYIGPFVPSVVAIYADAILQALEKGESIVRPVASFVGTFAFFVFVGWLNARAARKLRGRRDELPLAEEEGKA